MVSNFEGTIWKMFINRFLQLSVTQFPARTIATSSRLHLKEIREVKKGPTITVEGVHVESPRRNKLAIPPPEAKGDSCPLCRLGLQHLKYTDVLILEQFMEPGGKIMSIKDSQLCGRQYKKVQYLIKTAQMCKLLPRPADYEVYGPWDKLKTYHDWPPRKRDQIMNQIQPYYWKKIDFRKGDV